MLRVIEGLREALRFASAKPRKRVRHATACHECGGTLTLLNMRHSFYTATPSGVSERHTCTIPVWCCNECPASFHDHEAGNVIAATIRESRERYDGRF